MFGAKIAIFSLPSKLLNFYFYNLEVHFFHNLLFRQTVEDLDGLLLDLQR